MATAEQPGSFRLIATLALTGLLSGIVLVGVFLLTQPRILRNQAEALYAAIYRVLPGTTEVRTFVVREGGLEAFVSPDGTLPAEPAVFAGHRADGSLVGYAVPAEGPGFMDTIRLIYGYDPSRRVIVGMQVLDSRETPGLGDKILTDDAFLANFAALSVEPEIVAVKKGEKARPNEVDCITGATISSEAVVGILERSARQWAPRLAPGEGTTDEGSRDVTRARR